MTMSQDLQPLAVQLGTYHSFTYTPSPSKSFHECINTFTGTLDTATITTTQPIIFIESPTSDPEGREQSLVNLFSNPSITSALFLPSPVAALYSIAHDTGVVLDIGHTTTTISHVHNGLVTSTSMLEAGSRDITFELISLCDGSEQDFSFWNSLKESLCFVEGVGIKSTGFSRTIFDLPDRQDPIIITSAAHLSPLPFIDQLLPFVHSFLSCLPPDVPLPLSVLLIGGGSKLAGLARKISLELTGSVTPLPVKDKYSVLIGDTKNLSVSCVLGVSFVYNLLQDEELYISRKDYEEMGSSVVHVKGW
ncbi:hypothetical protein P9112_009713 [Eukaryota sp. TZLM1-RC]